MEMRRTDTHAVRKIADLVLELVLVVDANIL